MQYRPTGTSTLGNADCGLSARCLSGAAGDGHSDWPAGRPPGGRRRHRGGPAPAGSLRNSGYRGNPCRAAGRRYCAGQHPDCLHNSCSSPLACRNGRPRPGPGLATGPGRWTGRGRGSRRWNIEHTGPDAVLIFHQASDRGRHTVQSHHCRASDPRFPAVGSRRSGPSRRCARRCRDILRRDPVIACALCRADRRPVVRAGARLPAEASVRRLPGHNRRPPAAAMMHLALVLNLALGQSGRIVFSCRRSGGSDPTA